MCFGYGAALYATEDDLHLLMTPGNGARAIDKEHVKYPVHRIPNDFRIVDSARTAIVLS
jgi:hypothetical protein